MSFKDKVVSLCIICLSSRVVLTSCQVTLVTRNVTDSFRIGKDGCTNDTSVCESPATCQPNGLCVCSSGHASFRNPTIVIANSLQYGKSHGCIDKHTITLNIGVAACAFGPLQLIPYSRKEPETIFPATSVQSCSLRSTWVKFPDNFTEMEQQWLNESYIDFSVVNEKMIFSWKISVPELQGTLITFNLNCLLNSNSYILRCLRAKIRGTWKQDGTNPATPEPITLESSSMVDKNTSTSTMLVTTSPTSFSNSSETSSNDDSSNSTIIIVAVVVPVVLLIVLVVVVWLLCKKKRSHNGPSRSFKRKDTPAKMEVFHHMNSSGNIRLPATNPDEAHQDKAGYKRTENDHINPGYSTPDIKRVPAVNGDLYAVPDKTRKNNDDHNGLSYLDPSALAIGGKDIETASDSGQPTEYATIAGFLKEVPKE